MTFAGTAPQSTRSAVSSANSSSRIIARVPPMAASFASMGRMARTPTQQFTARIKSAAAAKCKANNQGQFAR